MWVGKMGVRFGLPVIQELCVLPLGYTWPIMHIPIFAIRIFIRAISLGVLASTLLLAQEVAPHRTANTYHAPTAQPAAFVSPEIHADRTVTFRVARCRCDLT